MRVESLSSLGGLEQTLPSSWYYADDIYALEKERIFCREWLCAGREEELPAPTAAQRRDATAARRIAQRALNRAARYHPSSSAVAYPWASYWLGLV